MIGPWHFAARLLMLAIACGGDGLAVTWWALHLTVPHVPPTPIPNTITQRYPAWM